MNKISNPKNFLNGMEDIIPRKNDSPYQIILVIGDIHLCFNKLMSLWKKLNVTDKDLCIFLGDYIDRGNEGAKTLEWLFEQSNKENFIFLAGNHEFMFVETYKQDRELLDKIFRGEKTQLTEQDLKKYQATVDWVVTGGDKTINALLTLRQKNEFIVDEFLDFIRELPLSHTIEIDGKKYFAVHAGIRPGISLEEQSAIDLLWIRKEFFHRSRGYNGNDVIIVGHTPTQRLSRRDKARGIYMTSEDKFLVGHMKPDECLDNSKPFKIPNRNILMLDTGSWRSSISAVDIISGQYWQSDKDEDFRKE